MDECPGSELAICIGSARKEAMSNIFRSDGLVIKKIMIENKAFYILIILVLFVFMTGCAGQSGRLVGSASEGESAKGNEAAQEGKTGLGVKLVSDGKEGNPSMETTPGVGSSSPDSQDEGVVNSMGTAMPPIEEQVSGEGFVMIPGSESGVEAEAISNEWMSWPVYEDEEYLFSVHYPDHFLVILPDKPGKFNEITALHTVQFQDKRIVADGLGEFEPPKFTVDVFAGTGTQSLKDWISTNHFSSGNSALESIVIEGAKEAYRVTLNTLLAPNVFYYLVTDKHVYRVVHLGPEAETMLMSFKLAQE